MKIKQFIAYSLIYIGLIGILVFIQNSESYSLYFGFFNLKLPVAVWFILPIVIIVILAVLHMSYYGFGFFLKKRSFKNDSNLYDEIAKEVLLGFDSNKEFKSELFKNPSEITKFLSPFNGEYIPKIEDKNLEEIVDIIQKVKNKEVVDLKKYRLPLDSMLFIQNELNKLDKDSSYAFDILKDRKKSEIEPLKNRALDILPNIGTFNDIKKYNLNKSKENIKLIVDRYVEEAKFDIPNEELYTMLFEPKFDADEYIEFAKKLSKKLKPENMVAIFEKIKSQKEEACEAHLYLLYEYGMIDDIREILNYSNEKFDKIQTLMFLRDNGKNIPASYFY